MDKELSEKINLALDNAMSEFRDNEESIFHNEKKDRLKYKYNSINSLKKWKEKQTCIVQNCNKKSIKRSHTIQKSGSIKIVSENNHVLTPRFNMDNGNIEMISVGINEASTFPGYCTEHESLFEEFETIKDIQTQEHLTLQLYRTICREIVVNENEIKSSRIFIEQYKLFRNQEIEKSFLKIPDLNIKKLNLEYMDKRLMRLDQEIKKKEAHLKGFLYNFHKDILKCLKQKKLNKIAYYGFDVDREIPITFAGYGNFHIKLKTKLKSVGVIINILPFENKTYIFIATLKKFTKELKAYTSQFANHPLNVINFIESCMIHGSDHWFIKPSVWNKINMNYQKIILERIMDDKYNIGHNFDLTIFNDVKAETIDLMEQHYSDLNQQLIKLLNQEKKKKTC